MYMQAVFADGSVYTLKNRLMEDLWFIDIYFLNNRMEIIPVLSTEKNYYFRKKKIEFVDLYVRFCMYIYLI